MALLKTCRSYCRKIFSHFKRRKFGVVLFCVVTFAIRIDFCHFFSVFLSQVFFQDDTVDAVASMAIAANAALVVESVRCMPLPASRMPAHAVPLGQERFSASAEKDGTPQEDDFTVFLTRPCLSFDQVFIFSPCFVGFVVGFGCSSGWYCCAAAGCGFICSCRK